MTDLSELAAYYAGSSLRIDGVYLCEIAPGHYYGHTSDNRTPHSGFVCALGGEAVFGFEGTVYSLAPGQVVHGGKGMTLSLDVPETAAFEYVLVHYTCETPAAGRETDYSQEHYRLETGEQPAIVESLRMLYAAAGTPGTLQALRTKALFYGILDKLLHAARNQANTESARTIEHILEYVHSHYTEPITLRSLATAAGLDVKSFSYQFHKYVGIFPIDYVIRHRIERAKHLLATTRSPVNDIAECVGYADAHYFSRLFRKHAGISPSDFRIRLGNCPPRF